MILNECSCFIEFIKQAGERDKMQGLPGILFLLFIFRNEFNKFNYTRARILDSICHMTIRLF